MTEMFSCSEAQAVALQEIAFVRFTKTSLVCMAPLKKMISKTLGDGYQDLAGMAGKDNWMCSLVLVTVYD